MLINLSNHSSDEWGLEQTNAGLGEFQHTEDIPFPTINPYATTEEVYELAEEYFYRCLAMFEDYAETIDQDFYHFTVHIQGEFTFTYALVNMLKAEGIPCVTSTFECKAIDLGNGKKEAQLTFAQFREY